MTLLCQEFESVQCIVSEPEAAMTHVCYYEKDGVLMRKWSPLDTSASEEWRVVSQIVVPAKYQMDVLHLAHKAPPRNQ